MRRFSALVAAASVATALTACSGGAPSSCTSDVTSGETSSIVEAGGDFGTAPEVEFPTPLVANTTERSVLIDGDEAPLQIGQPVIIEATLLNAADGTVLQETGYAAGGGVLFTLGNEELPALGNGLECTSVGSRVAIVESGEESAGGAAAGQAIVYVVDVLRAFPSRATGTDRVPEEGMPSVVTAPDGRPGITIPNEPAPTDYRTAVLKRGDGVTIEADDEVVAKLTVVDWDTEEVVQSTWTAGSAAGIDLAGEAVSEGLKQAIEGQTVGSQVLAVVPPGLGGTAEAPTSATVVYVIDILGTRG